MAKFIKKPIIVEAIQWFKHGDHSEVKRVASAADPNMGIICTLEGLMNVTPGDWIIKGIKGEYYPCKPDIFEATYDPIELGPLKFK